MRPAIELSPPQALHERRRLFAAVAEATGVRFVPSGGPGGDVPVAGRVALGDRPGAAGVPTLTLGPGSGEPAATTPVHLSDAEALDGCLRGSAVADQTVAGTRTLRAGRDDEVLATVGGRPIWIGRGRLRSRAEWAVRIPDELAPDETLLSRFSPGRFVELLPLINFLRAVTSDGGWTHPPLMASFIMDDPNLHAPCYGYLDFRALARTSRFHLTLSTIPLDRWYAHPKTVRLFRDNPGALSLIVHGNNHTRHELADGRDDDARLAMLAQALRRVRSFSRSTSVPVSEVMSAPHGRCSEPSARDMARLGFEALCISRPFPWLDRPPATHPLAGWAPADTCTPTPILVRRPFAASGEWLPLRAYLRQPLIVYGHHWDLADRPHGLEEWADRISRLGDVRWTSVGAISRSMASFRRDGDLLVVRPHTRLVQLTVPEAVTRLLVDGPTGEGYEGVEITGPLGACMLRPGVVASVTPREPVAIRLAAADAVDPDRVADPRWSPWPIVRRALTEARDRSRPWADAVRRR